MRRIIPLVLATLASALLLISVRGDQSALAQYSGQECVVVVGPITCNGVPQSNWRVGFYESITPFYTTSYSSWEGYAGVQLGKPLCESVTNYQVMVSKPEPRCTTSSAGWFDRGDHFALLGAEHGDAPFPIDIVCPNTCGGYALSQPYQPTTAPIENATPTRTPTRTSTVTSTPTAGPTHTPTPTATGSPPPTPPPTSTPYPTLPACMPDMRYADLDRDGILEFPGDDEVILSESYDGHSVGESGFDLRLDFDCDLRLNASDKAIMQGYDGAVVDMTCPVNPMRIYIVADQSCYIDSNCSGNLPPPSQQLRDIDYIRDTIIAMIDSIDARHEIGVATISNNTWRLIYGHTTNHSALRQAVIDRMQSGAGTTMDTQVLGGVLPYLKSYTAGSKAVIFISTFAPNAPVVFSGCPSMQWPDVIECAAVTRAETLKVTGGVNFVSALAQSSTQYAPVPPHMELLQAMSSNGNVYAVPINAAPSALLQVINDINAAACVPNATATPTPTSTATRPPQTSTPVTGTPVFTVTPGTNTPTPTRTPTRDPAGPTNTPTATPTRTTAPGVNTPTPTPTPTRTPTPVAWATVVANRDTYIGRYDPNATAGSAPVLRVSYTNSVGDEQVSLIGFNTSQWPNNRREDIRTALLKLYVEQGAGTIRVYRLHRIDWTEAATWYHTGTPGGEWFRPGMQITRDYLPYEGIYEVSVSGPGWITIEVTGLVRDALSVDPTYIGVNIRR